MLVSLTQQQLEKHEKLSTLDRDGIRRVFTAYVSPDRVDSIDQTLNFFCNEISFAVAKDAPSLGRRAGKEGAINELKEVDRLTMLLLKALAELPAEARNALTVEVDALNPTPPAASGSNAQQLARKLESALRKHGITGDDVAAASLLWAAQLLWPKDPLSLQRVGEVLFKFQEAIPKAIGRVEISLPSPLQEGANRKDLERNMCWAAFTAYECLTGERPTRIFRRYPKGPTNEGVQLEQKTFVGFATELSAVLGVEFKTHFIKEPDPRWRSDPAERTYPNPQPLMP
jgi:hypothetical protein